ncbi:hypothetical protein, partial [uncultured Spongiibacter sp.]|uniref:hypothetical protein n=1 Tax=uncultured Spongiibacter sp. TaxID=870896 RepID=UPI0025981262
MDSIQSLKYKSEAGYWKHFIIILTTAYWFVLIIPKSQVTTGTASLPFIADFDSGAKGKITTYYHSKLLPCFIWTAIHTIAPASNVGRHLVFTYTGV